MTVHLVVVVHGMWGSIDNVATIAETIRAVHTERPPPDVELDVLLAETNQNVHTYDGIDFGAGRIVEEVRCAREHCLSAARVLTSVPDL